MSTVLFCGPRDLTSEQRQKIIKILEVIDFKIINTILHGGARGTDTIVNDWVAHHKPDVKIKIYSPKYHEGNPRVAPLLRNNEMIKECDYCIAFSNGVSKGTQYVIENCEKQNVRVVKVDL